MTEDTSSMSASQPAEKRKRADFSRGKPRHIPCKPCVEEQLKKFYEGRWKETCCDQTTQGGKATACYQCRVARKECRQLDIPEPAIREWAAIQRAPERYDEETAEDEACSIKLHILKSSAAIPALQESHCKSLKLLTDSIYRTTTFLEDIVRNHLGHLDDCNAGSLPGIAGQQSQFRPAEQAMLDRLSECRKLEDALILTGQIVNDASVEVGKCQEDVMRKL